MDHPAEAGSAARADAQTTRKRVLVVRLDAIGDWILFRNALRALRRSHRYADAHFTVFGNPTWRGLAETFDRDLADEWLWAERRGDLFRKSYENLLPRAIWHRRVARAQGRLRERLLAGRFDEVLSLQPIRDPLLDELVSGLAPEVVGVRDDGVDSSMYTRLLDPGPEPFVFLQTRALVSQLAGEPVSEPLSLETGATRRGRDVLVFTGASHWTRRWPRRRVRALLKLLLNRTDRRVLLADGAHVASLHAFARSFHSPRVSALPAMSLADFARRVATMGVMIANDTMALHLAAATDTPVIGIANGISGRGGFWPYPASLGKRVEVLGTELRHAPSRFLPSLVASQLAQARNLASVTAEMVVESMMRMEGESRCDSQHKENVHPGRKCLRFLLGVGRFINRNLLRSSWIARHIPFRNAVYRILAPSLSKEEIARMPQNFRCDIIEKKVAAAVLKNEDQTVRFVVLLVESLGDIVSCEPICRHLKTLAPNSRIAWIVKPKYADVLAAFPLVDEVLEVESVSRGFDLCSELETNNGAIVVNCHFDKSFCGESKRILRNPCNPSVNADTYYAIGNLLETFCLAAGLPRLKEAPSLDLSRHVCNLPDYLPPHFAVFHCHSADVNRDWTDGNWKALADWMFKRGIPVVEVGFPKTITSSSPLYIDMTGRRNALDVAAVIQRSDLFVGVDSGFAHFANAFQIPSVVLLGRFTVFDQYFPYSGPFSHSRSFQCVRAPMGEFAKTIELDRVEAEIQQVRTLS